MRLLPPVTLLVLALLCPLRASAETTPRALSWQECKDWAYANNPTLSAARHSLQSARAQYSVSLNSFFPALNLNHSFSRSGDASGTNPDNWSAGASLSLSLLDFGNIKDLKSKKTSVLKAEETLRQTEVSVRKTLRSAFAELLYSQDRIGLMREIADLRVKNAKMVSLQYEGGRESKGNMMRAKALAEQAEADISKAQLSLAGSQRKLIAALGLDSLKVLSASGTLAVPARPADPDIDSVAQNAPAVKVGGYTVELSRIALETARTAAYPTLTASQSVNWTGRQELPKDRAWALGLALNLPVFASGPTGYWNSKSGAEQLLLSAKETYRQTLLDTATAAQTAWNSLISALYDCRTDLLLLEASRQRHSESTIKYLAGSMIFENWESVEQELVNAEKSYLDTLRNTALSEAEWQALAGKTLGED